MHLDGHSGFGRHGFGIDVLVRQIDYWVVSTLFPVTEDMLLVEERWKSGWCWKIDKWEWDNEELRMNSQSGRLFMM